jgi:hypothetical protein
VADGLFVDARFDGGGDVGFGHGVVDVKPVGQSERFFGVAGGRGWASIAFTSGTINTARLSRGDRQNAVPGRRNVNLHGSGNWPIRKWHALTGQLKRTHVLPFRELRKFTDGASAQRRLS